MTKFNQQKYINQFKKENYDRITIEVPKGHKERLKKALDGKSANSFLNEVIKNKIENP
jgi:hypothetical protein